MARSTTWLPSADYVESVHRELTQIFANEEDPISPPGLKNKGLLESACERPNISLGGIEKYGTKFEKIAALFHSLTKNHAFHNGNKRTSIVTLLTTLYRNDRKFVLTIGDDEIFDFAIRVTADTFPNDSGALQGDALIGAIASWLDANSESLDRSVSAMRITEFLEKCEAAGCEVKKSGKGGSWNISNPGKGSIRISQSTPKIEGKVVARFLDNLKLTASTSGLLSSEFEEGAGDERQQLHRYMVALRRLAKT